MIKYLLVILFMIPLRVVKKRFWINQYLYFCITLVFIVNIGYNHSFINISYFLGYDLLSYIIILLRF